MAKTKRDFWSGVHNEDRPIKKPIKEQTLDEILGISKDAMIEEC